MFAGHAHFVKGTADDIDSVLALLKERAIETHGNPDLYVRRYGQFTIDDARGLIGRAALRALKGRRVFVIAVDSINAEAQNALLKTLEEPPGGGLFFFVHPAPETLLPTVLSRVQLLPLPKRAASKALVDVTEFLNAVPAKRLDMLKPLLEKDEDERRNVGEILTFLSALEKKLETADRRADAVERLCRAEPSGRRLHAIYRARRYIGDRGALVKALLVQVALLV